MQLKRKKMPFSKCNKGRRLSLCTFPNVHVQISPAGPGCALLNDWLTSAVSFSLGSLITTSILAKARGIVPVIHLVQCSGEVTTTFQWNKECIEGVCSCQSQMRMLRTYQDLEQMQQTSVLNLTNSTSVFILSFL